jgi:hypothetical protein
MGVDHVVDVDGRYETPPRDVLRRARRHWRAPGGWGQVVEGDVAIELERRWKLEHAVTAHTAAQYVGASPGVYAVGAAFGAHLLLNWDETPGRVLWAVHLLGVAALDVWSYAAMYDERIAYASHVAGAFVGSPHYE